MENEHILHAVKGLPKVVPERIVVRQVAVDAELSPVRARMGPCLELRFHHVASGTEIGRVCSREQLWRTQQQEDERQNPRRGIDGKISSGPDELPDFHIAPDRRKKIAPSRLHRLTLVNARAVSARAFRATLANGVHRA